MINNLALIRAIFGREGIKSQCPTGHETWYIRLRESSGVEQTIKPQPNEQWKGRGKQKKKFIK